MGSFLLGFFFFFFWTHIGRFYRTFFPVINFLALPLFLTAYYFRWMDARTFFHFPLAATSSLFFYFSTSDFLSIFYSYFFPLIWFLFRTWYTSSINVLYSFLILRERACVDDRRLSYRVSGSNFIFLYSHCVLHETYSRSQKYEAPWRFFIPKNEFFHRKNTANLGEKIANL